MASSNLQTTNFGDGLAYSQPGYVRIRSKPTQDEPGRLILEAVNDSGTQSNVYLWADANGVLHTATSNTSNQDATTDYVVRPAMASTAMQEMPIIIPFFSLSSGTDVSNRVVYRNTSTLTLNRGSAFVCFTARMSVTSGQTCSIGIGGAAANDLFGRSFTSTQSAGSITSLTTGSVTTLAASSNLRLDITNSASQASPSGWVLWIPQKRGSS